MASAADHLAPAMGAPAVVSVAPGVTARRPLSRLRLLRRRLQKPPPCLLLKQARLREPASAVREFLVLAGLVMGQDLAVVDMAPARAVVATVPDPVVADTAPARAVAAMAPGPVVVAMAPARAIATMVQTETMMRDPRVTQGPRVSIQ